MHKKSTAMAALVAAFGILHAYAAPAKMATPIPPQITTPDQVETRLGTLNFGDGVPDKQTVATLYDNLDFMRGVETFLNNIPGASMVAIRRGLHSVGLNNGTVGIFETLMDARSLFLTPNSESVYAMTWLDLNDGPVVVESPPNTLGVVNDFWFRYVSDLGNAGPDRGQGGKYLFLPPGYSGEVPEGYFVVKSPTYGNILIWRAFMVQGDPRPSVDSLKQHTRVYPLSRAVNPPEQKFVNLSGKAFNTIHSNDYSFYEELNQIVQEEPSDALDPERQGLLAAIGMEKGKPFAPDARMKKILSEAAAVGNATARALLFDTREQESYFYPNSYWHSPFVGGSHEFLRNGTRLLDARSMFFYTATMVTPAMSRKMVGVGSQYGYSANDAQGLSLDGGKTYKINIPANPPVKNFWSLVVYDTQTRSMLQTDQAFPSVDSQKTGMLKNADGSTDVYFGPSAPKGQENNWIQTVPGKSWHVLLRLYGPLEPWFDKSWRPGEIERMN